MKELKLNKSEKLEALLKVRENQYRMLNKTLDELKNYDMEDVIESQGRIRLIYNEIDNTLNEMKEIKKDIEKAKEAEAFDNLGYDEAEYRGYEASEFVNGNFYDSIVKQPKIANIEAEKCGRNCICHSVGKDVGGTTATASTASTSNKFVKDIMEREKNMLSCNNFMVNILGIPMTMVKSVAFDMPGRRLLVTLYEFVENGVSLFELIHTAFKGAFSMSIDRLDKAGKVKSSEVYDMCKIIGVDRSCLDYSVSDFSTISLEIEYETAEYEAAKQ